MYLNLWQLLQLHVGCTSRSDLPDFCAITAEVDYGKALDSVSHLRLLEKFVSVACLAEGGDSIFLSKL